MWVIIIEFRSREIPQVFEYPTDEQATAAFDRLATSEPWRMTLWERVWGTSELHEFARLDNSAN